MDQYFESENSKPRKSFFSWDQVGAKITGVYIGKVKNPQEDQWGKIKVEYIFKTKDGIKFVSGRHVPQNPEKGFEGYCILYPMLGVKPGTVMGLKYAEDKKTKMGNPTKVIEAIFPDKPMMDMEAVQAFKDEFGMFYDLESGAQFEEGAEKETDISDIPFSS